MAAITRRRPAVRPAVEKITNYINGERVIGRSVPTRGVFDPGTGDELGRVPMSGKGEVDAAVQAAKEAFPAWRATPVIERVRCLFRLKSLLEEHLEDLSRILSREHGKNLTECRGELRRAIENVEHACGMPTLMMGETLEDIARGIDCETIRQPIGVFAAITPYNFPAMIPCWFWPYAVAAGNTFVLKPSEKNPLTHQRILLLVEEAGFPPGVLNVVHGGVDAVETLLDHPDVVGVSFVGSSPVARMVYRRAAASGKRVQALGGAKNHMIVLPDADMDMAARALLDSLFGSAGQRCLAGSMIVGVGDAYPEIRERFLDGASSLQLGYGLDAGSEMGPVISADHQERVRGYVERGKQENLKLALDRTGESVDGYPRGFWVGPAVFEDVDPRSTIGRTEIFGPVAALARVETLDEAITMMGASDFGNATSLFTTSGKAERDFRYRAAISMIGINIGVAAPMAFFPLGGSRTSFFGDLRAQGTDAIAFYTDRRVVISRW